MSGDITLQKRHLHDLLVEAMVDPVAHAVAHAPVDPDPLSEDETEALKEAKEWLSRNPAIPHEQVLAELGITSEEIEAHKDHV